jgi:hypothetical protein
MWHTLHFVSFWKKSTLKIDTYIHTCTKNNVECSALKIPTCCFFKYVYIVASQFWLFQFSFFNAYLHTIYSVAFSGYEALSPDSKFWIGHEITYEWVNIWVENDFFIQVQNFIPRHETKFIPWNRTTFVKLTSSIAILKTAKSEQSN